MLSFEASIHIGGADQAVPAVHRGISDFLSCKDLHRNRRVGLVLISISVVFGLLCLSNDLHHLLMTIRYTDTEYTISYHLFYYIIFVWSAVLSIAAFIILIRRCRTQRVDTLAHLWYNHPMYANLQRGTLCKRFFLP